MSKNELDLSVKNNLKSHLNKDNTVKAFPLKSYKTCAVLMSVALLAGCNENDHDVQADKTKPVISVTNPSLVMGVVLDSTTPVSFTIADKNRIKATDNSGSVSLSVVDVVGLSKAQISLATDGSLTASNILASAAIGRGYVLVRATDNSGNYMDNKVYFDISPATARTQADVIVGQSLTLRFPLMANSEQASVSLSTNIAGVSSVTNLVGNELSITFNTNNSAIECEFKPKISVKTATGDVYSFVLNVNLQNAVPVDSKPPSMVSEDLPFIDFAGEKNKGTFTLSEPIANVSDVKFIDAKTGVKLTGGAATAKVSAVSPMIVEVEYAISLFGWASTNGIKLCFIAEDLAGNSENICSNRYDVN